MFEYIVTFAVLPAEAPTPAVFADTVNVAAPAACVTVIVCAIVPILSGFNAPIRQAGSRRR